MSAMKVHPDEVRRLAGEGYSQSMIASLLGVSRERIRQICNRDRIATISGHINFDKRDAALAAVLSGAHVAEAARLAGVAEATVKTAAADAGVTPMRWQKPSPVADQIKDLAAQGLTAKEVALRLGIQPNEDSLWHRVSP